MKITIEHHAGQYPSFNINLHSADGAEPFVTIKGCRIVSGQNGPFVSYPSRKQENGKYWNHVYGSEKFNAAVLAKAQQEAPKPKPPPAKGSGFDDMSDDIPFITSSMYYDCSTSKQRRMARNARF